MASKRAGANIDVLVKENDRLQAGMSYIAEYVESSTYVACQECIHNIPESLSKTTKINKLATHFAFC